MYVVLRLPGNDSDLSHSIQAMIQTVAKSWAIALAKNPLPPFYECNIRYRPEPLKNAAEEWVDPYTVFTRKYGDCDDLVIWRLAEIFNKSGVGSAWPAVAREIGTGKYHVFIRHRNGSFEDPAKAMLEKFGEK